MAKRPFIIDAAVVLPDLYILSGHCLKTTAIIQPAGDSSNLHLPNNSPDKPTVQNTHRQHKNNRRYGNIEAGNIACAMNLIFNAMLIIFTIIL
jgi:hypothetical protein